MRAAVDKNSDVVISGYRRPDGKRVRKTIIPPLRLSGGGFFKYTISAAWAKIHRTEFLRSNSIRFFNHRIGEDIVFSLAEIARTSCIDVIDYIGYNWYYNEESVSNTAFKSLVKNYDDIVILLEECRKFDTGNAEFEYFLIREIVFRILSCGRFDTSADFLVHTEQLFAWLESHYPSYRKNSYIKKPPQGEPNAFTGFAVRMCMFLKETPLFRLFARFYCR